MYRPMYELGNSIQFTCDPVENTRPVETIAYEDLGGTYLSFHLPGDAVTQYSDGSYGIRFVVPKDGMNTLVHLLKLCVSYSEGGE